jgi:hypothetical protein
VTRRQLRICDRVTLKLAWSGNAILVLWCNCLQRCGASEEPMNSTITTERHERQLLELAAQAIGFKYMLYVSPSHLGSGGLMYSSPNKRTKTWNPLHDDADLLHLAVASPSVSLQDFIVEAAGIDGDDAARRAYVRERFVRAVTAAGLAAAQKDASDAFIPGQCPAPATALEEEA